MIAPRSQPGPDARSRPAALPVRLLRSLQAAIRTTVFLIKVFPMIPSGWLDWLTRRPVIETVRYPRHDGEAAVADLYRPPGSGPFPAVVVCLGVVPFDVVHPQVARLGGALARSGLACLLHWSPSMRHYRLDESDIGDLVTAYQWLTARPDIDRDRAGLFGTCVGGSFALMAAAAPEIRDRVAFVGAYAPYASVWTLARGIATATRTTETGRIAWDVDPLTRRVFRESLLASLSPAEAGILAGEDVDEGRLSRDGRAVRAVLDGLPVADVDESLHRLPVRLQQQFDAVSPLNHLAGLRAPLVVLAHDRDDLVIPVSESRTLAAVLAAPLAGLHYQELNFHHLDPSGLRWLRLVRELAKFWRVMWRLFRV